MGALLALRRRENAAVLLDSRSRCSHHPGASPDTRRACDANLIAGDFHGPCCPGKDVVYCRKGEAPADAPNARLTRAP